MTDYGELKEQFEKLHEKAIVTFVKRRIESHLPGDKTIEESSDKELREALEKVKQETEEGLDNE